MKALGPYLSSPSLGVSPGSCPPSQVRREEPINQIETWFGIITRQSIRRGTFTSVTVLVKHIRDYINHWNIDPKPFTWTATTDEILAKVQLVQTSIKKLVDNNAK